MSARDTIFALSSGRPPAAIAVVRISGPRAGDALKALTGKLPSPRLAALARVRDPQSQEIIDEALALWFPAPQSETGEDVSELQLHGGRAVIAATLAALGSIEGLRPAEAGEFTRRAFESGKLDLTEVEGLADLVMAETEAQRRQAYRQLRGLLGNRAEAWREKLIRALALVEAAIDFSDEGDVPKDLLKPALAATRELMDEIGQAIADRRGERLRDGLVVAIAGPPNAGKSTLFNRIARREAAIVSPYPGTTRDVIEVHLDLAGLPVTLLDTAGIRETEHPVELEGVRRARDRAATADLVLWIEDATRPLTDEREKFDAPLVWVVRNKIDLLDRSNESKSVTIYSNDNKKQSNDTTENSKNEPSSIISSSNEEKGRCNEYAQHMVSKQSKQNNELRFAHEFKFNTSAKTGSGFEELLNALSRYAASNLGGDESALVTRERHRRALQDTTQALGRALGEFTAGREDLVAEELRLSARALGRLTGRVDIEDILDVIFRDFCIGK
jgi:tRNA modification GTPase